MPLREERVMTEPVVRIADESPVDFAPSNAGRFGAKVRALGKKLGTAGLGCKHIELAPGKRAFPYHNHLGNDEIFVILAGRGTYRYGSGEHPIQAGDVCGAPRGGTETAHQIINSGAEPLAYLAVSTLQDPDICEYPDSRKFAAFAKGQGRDFASAYFRYVGREDTALDYFDGEDP